MRYKSTYPTSEEVIDWVVSGVVDSVVSVVDEWPQHKNLNASMKNVHDLVPLSIFTAAVIASVQ